MKLVDLAVRSVAILRESGASGIRSDILADRLQVSKRRVYDVIAVLKAAGLVSTRRRYNGTTVTWLDPTRDYVPREEHEVLKQKLVESEADRRQLQVELAEVKEQLRLIRSSRYRDVSSTSSSQRVEFNTSQVTVRCLKSSGFRRVRDSGIEVIVESHEPGILVDPAEVVHEEVKDLLKAIQRR